ncbi:MAG: hypothetical protein AAF939_20765 [Planctomycetota bacterium]
MSIEFECPNCESVLRVPVETAGKRARCPQCQIIVSIPAADLEEQTLPPRGPIETTKSLGPQVQTIRDKISPASPTEYWVESVAGEVYGPVSKSELDNWAAQGRISAECRIRQTDHSASVAATVIYPELHPASTEYRIGSESKTTDVPIYEEGVTAVDPSSDSRKRWSPEDDTQAAIIPRTAELGSILSTAFDLLRRNLFLLLVTSGLMFLVLSSADRFILWSIASQNSQIKVTLLQLVLLYMTIGQSQIIMALYQGRKREIADLFKAGDLFFPVLLWSLVAMVGLTIGLAFLVVPGLAMLVLLWPSYFLVVQRRASFFESFSKAYQIGRLNVWNSVWLLLICFGVSTIGYLLYFGTIVSIAIISSLLTVAYFQMSGLKYPTN